MVRILSNGNDRLKGSNISLIDERSEVAAMYHGMPQNDIGIRTDVMNTCLKSIGIRMMVRSMAPQILATDEIGGKEDEDAIKEAKYAGIKLLLTAHGENICDVSKNLVDNKVFNNIIVLDKENRPGKIKKIYELKEEKYVSNY